MKLRKLSTYPKSYINIFVGIRRKIVPRLDQSLFIVLVIDINIDVIIVSSIILGTNLRRWIHRYELQDLGIGS